ncbi:DUF3080 family protein [Amphritea pacifica]|uniref:DUF3080 family protein n=1 Tax=Amphritea pacifica TaxID=2811233 RepID=A0ABS2W373_9GAMM|nr:DUF3080 family protein [Amphritea pacifica]MBN0986164.1 DUF3080 family protein [Amphritea pacifica]
MQTSHRFLITLIATVLLQGCDQRPVETMLERYSNRVANSLDSDTRLDLDIQLPLPAYPRRRERIRPVTDLRQGLIEVLNLRHCRLLNLIAERNSSLGKVMPPSRQLVYEIRLLAGLGSCRQSLQRSQTADPQLIRQVDQLYQIKKRDFEAALWNGIFTSEAMERNFSRSEPALSLNDDDGFSQSRQALLILNQVAALNSTIDSAQTQWTEPDYLDQLEPHYQALSTLRFGSRWLRSVYLITHTLEHTAGVIEARLRKRPLCFNKNATPKALIVKNVFSKYYAGELQPYMSRIDREGREWLQLNRRLLHNFNHIPPAMQRYQSQIIDADAPLWQNYIAARDRHTKAWQQLLSQCNLMPGS